jgi:hypothetical protein
MIMSATTPLSKNDRLEVNPFIAGQVYREQRPEAVQKIHDKIRAAYRGPNKQCIRLPKRLYLRVLAVMTNQVVVISTEDPRAREIFWILEQAKNLVLTGGWLLTDIEPLQIMRTRDDHLTDNQKGIRQKNTELIQPLIDLDEDALIAKIRWPVIKAISEDRQIDPRHIFRIFTKYLQGGMSTQALAGRWFRRINRIGLGARVQMAAQTGVRRASAGRPRLDGKKPFIVQEIDSKKIIAGARKNLWSGKTAGNWTNAWKLTVADEYLDLDCANGIPSKRELARFGPGNYPSYKQFCYWAVQDENYEMLLRKLNGDRHFELQKRRRRKKTEAGVKGSGAVYIIDATPLNWHLVHQSTRLPLKKKSTLYLVVDAFSHLIVGFYLHLGDESFDPISVALLSAAEDKVTLCARYGMTIQSEDWPVACLPTRLAEDGAGANYKNGALVKNKVIRGLIIVPAWRPDLKGLVEAYNAVFTKLAESVPGHTNGPRKRGEEDPVALACLDYYESCQLIISWILEFNERVDHDYQQTPEMMAAGIVASPNLLWEWGCEEVSGLRKKWPTESLMKMCLPAGRALLTRDGVEFGGMLYEPIQGTLPNFDNWCAQAAENGSRKVNVVYHPARYSELYLCEDDNLVKMKLAPRSELFATWSLADVKAYKESSSVSVKNYEATTEARNIARLKERYQIIENGVKQTAESRGSVAKRRGDKSDRDETLKDQKHRIAADGEKAPAEQAKPPASSDLQSEDEIEIVKMMKG